MPGFVLTSLSDPAMPANPLHGQTAAIRPGAWLGNYHAHPVLWLLPVFGTVCMVGEALLLRANRPALGWWLGVGAWAGTITTVGAAMFPFLMPSTTAPDQSITVWNGAGSL